MASSTFEGVRIAGVASAIPRRRLAFDDLASRLGETDASRISAAIGIRSRHVARGGLCASDLCAAAAERVLGDLGWAPESVEALIFVSQSPDYVLPATSCLLQDRLGLSTACASLDVSLGCSGYVYGLWLASSLLASGAVARALLLVGDTVSRRVAAEDHATYPLFGDAGTATALERAPGAPPACFELGTDGGGARHLIVPAGGSRHPARAEAGQAPTDESLHMDGAEVFAFTLREVPPMVRRVREAAGWAPDAVDAYVFHQANRMMLQHLTKKMRLPPERVLLDMEEFGNTSGASIPLALTHGLAEALVEREQRLVLAGFGVGLSWGAAAVTVGPCRVAGPLLVDEPEGEDHA